MPIGHRRLVVEAQERQEVFNISVGEVLKQNQEVLANLAKQMSNMGEQQAEPTQGINIRREINKGMVELSTNIGTDIKS